MWDTVVETATHLSHEMPCPTCGHGTHLFLACSDRCDCRGWRPSYGDGALALVLD
jgi:hypothetical protein